MTVRVKISINDLIRDFNGDFCSGYFKTNLGLILVEWIRMILAIFNVLFCVSFAAFAYMNLNDTDSWLWVPIYIVASVLCGLAVFDIHFPVLYIVVVCFYVLYAIKLFFERDGVYDWLTKYKQESIVVSMQTTKPYIEKTREFFGLLIISGALLLNYFLSH